MNKNESFAKTVKNGQMQNFLKVFKNEHFTNFSYFVF